MDIYTIIGHERHVHTLQMCARAFIIYFIGLAVIRLSGRRSFGIRTAFDNVILVALGTVLGSGIIGTASFPGAILGGALLAFLHRFCAWMSLRSPKFGNLIKGRSKILAKDGNVIQENLRKSLIDPEDFIEGVRINANVATVEETKMVFMERNGQISVVKKKKSPDSDNTQATKP